MQLPDAITDRVPALAALEEDWQPVSRIALLAWLAFYVILLLSAVAGGGSDPAASGGLLRWFDLVLLPVHEGGHLLFGWFGSMWLMVAGGTLMQLGVPFALAVYFVFRRQIPGTVFCGFVFFEQFLPIATYMADARSQSLTLVTVGDSDTVIHDWFYLFSSVGVVEHDTQIAAVTRVLGWIGMLAVVGWLTWQAWRAGATSS